MTNFKQDLDDYQKVAGKFNLLGLMQMSPTQLNTAWKYSKYAKKIKLTLENKETLTFNLEVASGSGDGESYKPETFYCIQYG